jgi:ADP-ribose pyrophosphatase YjhB (NUDIX family)
MQEPVDVTPHLARWSQALVGIAKTGLAFAATPYDSERYEQLLKLAAEMTATLNPRAVLNSALAAQLESAWHAQVAPGFHGYETPKISVGAIVFNAQNELLLVHSAIRQDWCFPVGMADIGDSPAEVACKEVREEAGVSVTPLHLIGVADSFRRGFNRAVHVYSLLFYCQLDGGEVGSHTAEITAAGFFPRENLPHPLNNHGEPWVADAFDWHFGTRRQAYFD